MSFATDKWFQHIRGEVLTEGLADIGLDEDIQEEIMDRLPEASEKGRVWVGNAWKSISENRLSSYGWFGRYMAASVGPLADKFIYSEEETMSRNILWNLITVYNNQSPGKWPKAKRRFVKTAKKKGSSDEDIQSVLLRLKEIERRSWNWFASRIENVLITLNQNPNNYDIIKSFPPSDWGAAEAECFEFQSTQEDPDQIMHAFDDGSYWYDLDTYRCEMEGNRMGHCGTDNRGTLYSLRKKDKGKKSSKSYVTIAYNLQEETIYQIKGRQNTCPPRELWGHIQTFIDITGAQQLKETGEYSNDPEDFEELGQWLEENTGIDFVGSMDKRLEEFEREVIEIYEQWSSTEYSKQADTQPPDIDLADFGGDYAPKWDATLESVASKLPFDATEKLIRALYITTLPRGMRQRLGMEEKFKGLLELGDEIEDRIDEIVKNEDRNDILKKDFNDYSEIRIVRANDYTQAFLKCDSFGNLKIEQLMQGDNSYIVLWNLGAAYANYASSFSFPTEAETYSEWLEGVDELIEDLDDAVDEIEDFLVSRALINRPDIKGYVDKVEEEFNNFIVSDSTTQGRGVYELFATGLLFKTTDEQIQTLSQIGFFQDLRMLNNGALTNDLIENIFFTTIKKHDAQAKAFAKKQLKLNFGEEYAEKSKVTMNQAYRAFHSYSQAGITVPKVKRQGAFRPTDIHYKLTVSLDKNSLPLLGPYLEYYDNNFDIIIKAFEEAVKSQIEYDENMYQQRTGSDTSLPVSEAKANPLDVRLYEMDFVMSYPLGMGYEITDIHNIIRAIPDVTTVRTVGNSKRTQGNRTISLQRLKFALKGQKPREEWVRQILLPQIRKISQDIRIHKVERADLVSASRQRMEEAYGYFNSTQRPSTPRTTPRPTIQGLIDDWVEGGVMYDQPTNLNLTRYSVMMPVADLEHLCSRHQRKHGHHFDAGYENFIQNGPRDPIYLAIGKNGRAKITGNEDDLRYAIKAGVEEVPVFISYQRQV
jgi:hypothetical protein